MFLPKTALAFALATLLFSVTSANAQSLRITPQIAGQLQVVSGHATVTVAQPNVSSASLSYTGASNVVAAENYVSFPANPTNGESNWVELSFMAAAGTNYIVECQLSDVDTASMGVQIGSTPGSYGTVQLTAQNERRASVLVPRQTASGLRRVRIAGRGGSGWRFSSCSIYQS